MKTEKIYKIASFFMQNVERDIAQILQNKTNLYSQEEIIVFDIGCYKGLFSQRLNNQLRKTIDNKIKYFLFDPNLRVKEYLSGSLDFEYNYHQLAISNSKGEKDFYYNPVIEFSMSSLDGRFLKSKLWRYSRSFFTLRRSRPIKKFKVNTDTIDLFCKQNKVSSIDILKIDVEGTQLDVLKGAEEMLQNISVIFIEILEEKKYFRESSKKVKTLLEAYNFVLFQEAPIFTTKILSPYKASDCIFIKNTQENN